MNEAVIGRLRGELAGLREQGLYKTERVLASPQGGVFETLLDERDAVISDALNHASIIDGIRLCKAQRYRYANSDMGELEQCLKQTSTARTRLIATDGVFSMDGFIAKLAEICDL